MSSRNLGPQPLQGRRLQGATKAARQRTSPNSIGVALALTAAIWIAGVLNSGPVSASSANCDGAPSGKTAVALVIDNGSSTPQMRCVVVASGATGRDVLRAAGVSFRVGSGTPADGNKSGGFLCGISGFPETGCGVRVGSGYAYWSYWRAEPNTSWAYSRTGFDASVAGKCAVEGWRWTGASGGVAPESNPRPRIQPPAVSCSAPRASTATSRPATSRPTVTSRPSTSRPTVTSRPTTSRPTGATRPSDPRASGTQRSVAPASRAAAAPRQPASPSTLPANAGVSNAQADESGSSSTPGRGAGSVAPPTDGSNVPEPNVNGATTIVGEPTTRTIEQGDALAVGESNEAAQEPVSSSESNDGGDVPPDDSSPVRRRGGGPWVPIAVTFAAVGLGGAALVRSRRSRRAFGD